MTKAFGSTRAILLGVLMLGALGVHVGSSAAAPQDPTITRQVAPGITYLYYGDAETHFHAVVIDRSYSQYELRVIAHDNPTNDRFTSHSVTEFAENISVPRAIVAINGWYWQECTQVFWTAEWKRCKGFSQWTDLVPQDPMVLDGDIIVAPGAASRRIMGFSQSFGEAGVDIGILQFHSLDWMAGWTLPFMHYARGTNSSVLVNGQCNGNLGARDKRSAIGYSADKIVLLSLDQQDTPRDADISDLCWFFALHGVRYANLLDGGPSAQMYVRGVGAPVNPREAGGAWYPAGYRYVLDAIGVVQVCQPVADTCTLASECCDGLSCYTGTCQPVSVPECASDADCLATEYCGTNGACLPDTCSQSAYYCDGDERWFCNANGSVASFDSLCPFGCTAGVCQNECATPSASRTYSPSSTARRNGTERTG